MGKLEDEIQGILLDLRFNIETSDDDFHYDYVVDALEKIMEAIARLGCETSR